MDNVIHIVENVVIFHRPAVEKSILRGRRWKVIVEKKRFSTVCVEKWCVY